MSVNLLIFSHKITFALECHKTARHFKNTIFFIVFLSVSLFKSKLATWRFEKLNFVSLTNIFCCQIKIYL